MLWLLISLNAFAQSDEELKSIQALEDQSKQKMYSARDEEFESPEKPTRFQPPYKIIRFSDILASGTERGHVKAGTEIIRIKDNHKFILAEDLYTQSFKLEDQFNLRYLKNQDGSCLYKIKSRAFNSVEADLEMYVPPLSYTPAPKNRLRSDFDQSIHFHPEVTYLAGMVQGNYMRDLFNDEKARTGYTNQYGFQAFTDWKWPIKVGAVVKFEKSIYYLQNGNDIQYSSTSFGPLFKSKDYDWSGFAVRFQTQMRISPFARASAETANGQASFKFNSTDLLLLAEHPIKNSWGDFNIGLFYQSQWLNIKDQTEIVKVKASNKSNNGVGISLAQVFE